MRVVVIDAGYGGNDYPGEVRVRVETDDGWFVAEVLIAEDIAHPSHDGRVSVDLEISTRHGAPTYEKAVTWPRPPA